MNGRAGITGASAGEVSNGVYLKDFWFDKHLNSPIRTGATAGRIESGIAEPPIAGSTAARFLEITWRGLEVLNMIGNQLNDATTSGTWILTTDGAITGGSIVGNFFQGGAGHVSMNLGASRGMLIAATNSGTATSSPPRRGT